MTVRFLHCKDPLFSYSFGHSYSFILSHSWLYINTLFLPQNLHLKCLSSTVWIATLRIKNWGWWDVPADKRSCCTWVQIPEVPCRHIWNPRAATKEGKIDMGGCYSCRTQHNDRQRDSVKQGAAGVPLFQGLYSIVSREKTVKGKTLKFISMFSFHITLKILFNICLMLVLLVVICSFICFIISVFSYKDKLLHYTNISVI